MTKKRAGRYPTNLPAPSGGRRSVVRAGLLLGGETQVDGVDTRASDELPLAGAEVVVDVGGQRHLEPERLGAPSLLGDRRHGHARVVLATEHLALARAVLADDDEAVEPLLGQGGAVEGDLAVGTRRDAGEVHAVHNLQEVPAENL